MVWGRRRAEDDVVGTVRGLLGLSRFAAAGMVRPLRAEVTDTVCQLLPGVEQSSGHRWLQAVGAQSARLATDLVPLWEPAVAQEHLSAALMHSAWLLPVAEELAGRRVAAPARTRNAAPQPRPGLVAYRRRAEDLVSSTLAAYHRSEDTAALRAQKAALVIGRSDPADAAWGAWTTLAAVQAIDAHDHLLPRPGRSAAHQSGEAAVRARHAGLGFLLGHAIVLDTALGLVAAAG